RGLSSKRCRCPASPSVRSASFARMTKTALLPSDKLRAQAAADEPLEFRQPPHNIEAEQALLGAILINNEAMDRVAGFLEAQHFSDPLHQQIYEVAAKLIQAGKQ